MQWRRLRTLQLAKQHFSNAKMAFWERLVSSLFYVIRMLALSCSPHPVTLLPFLVRKGWGCCWFIWVLIYFIYDRLWVILWFSCSLIYQGWGYLPPICWSSWWTQGRVCPISYVRLNFLQLSSVVLSNDLSFMLCMQAYFQWRGNTNPSVYVSVCQNEPIRLTNG